MLIYTNFIYLILEDISASLPTNVINDGTTEFEKYFNRCFGIEPTSELLSHTVTVTSMPLSSI